MLATLADAPFDRRGWFFEVKWDGYRAIAEVGKGRVSLYSRNQQPFEQRFAPIVAALRRLKHSAVLDGEIVVVDRDGRPDFELLQNYQRTSAGTLRYYVFDLLFLDGRDLRGQPLHRRKELLAEAIADLPGIYLSEHVEEHGLAFFKVVAD